jgi:hypothetical protein
LGVVLSLIVILSVAGAGAQRAPGEQRLVNLGEWSARALAVVAPAPEFPVASVAAGRSGVAVAAVAFDVEGRMTTVVVLEAPDSQIGDALRAALLTWTFRPARYPGPDGNWVQAGGRARLTFYYDVVAGKGRVRGADEMPGARVPPRPARNDDAPPPPPPGRGAPPGAAPTRTAADDAAAVIDEAALARLVAEAKPTILDARDRQAYRQDHRAGAVNIPYEELPVRGPIELPADRPIVIDCRDAELYCRAYAHAVSSYSRRVFILRR